MVEIKGNLTQRKENGGRNKMEKYVVTGYVKENRKREVLTIKLDYNKARKVLSAQKRILSRSIPKYRWGSNFKIKKVK